MTRSPSQPAATRPEPAAACARPVAQGHRDFFIGIEATRHCNLRCAHCFRADLDRVSEIPLETVRSLLEQARRYHRPHIALTGGEATLHSRFPELLELIIAQGYSFHYVTNGYNFQQTFRRLFHLFGHPLWIGVSVSLDGASAATQEAVRGPGTYAQALGAIAVARAHDLEVVVQMVVHRGNRAELEAMALLCGRMNVSRLHIAHLQPTPHAVSHGLLPSPAETRAIEREVADLQGRFRLPIVLSAGFYDQTPIAHCRFLKLGALHFDYRGRLVTCCQLSNLEGSSGAAEVVADLAELPLEQAHELLLDNYQQLFRARLRRLQQGTLHDLDNFHCWSCAKHYGKVDWMSAFPDNAWVRDDPYFQQRVRR